MIDEVYNFNLNYVVETIKESRAQTVGLQFPDGFKRKAIGIAEEIEKRTDTRVLISANPCFGACDVDTWLSGAVDILFHFGHAEIPEIGAHVPNTIFIEAESRIDPVPVVEKAVFEIEAGVAAHLRQPDRSCALSDSSQRFSSCIRSLVCSGILRSMAYAA